MLEVEGVSKRFEPPTGWLRLLVRSATSEPVTALHRIDFGASPGEIVGLVGPNGAGKSTLIRICTSLLTPTEGRVLIGGRDITEHRATAAADLGLHLGDERGHYWRLTGRENLRFFGMMFGLTDADARRRADDLLEQFDLASRDRRVFGYSSGMRVRLGLARALIARPKLLLLDEPSRSLDPLASVEFMSTLQELADEGVAIVLSSHRLDEVETICDRVLVMVNGEQRAWMSTAELVGDSNTTTAAAIRAVLERHDDSSGKQE